MPVHDRGAVVVGTPVTGRRDEGELDRWTLAGVKREYVRIETSGMDPVLRLRTTDGEVVAEDDDSGEGTAARIQTTLPATGAYSVEVRGFEDVFAFKTGTYTLTRR